MVNEAEALQELFWTDQTVTVDELKNRTLAGCCEILKNHDVTWEEFRNSRAHSTREARGRVCALVWVVLKPWMSENDMSEFLSIKRSRLRWAALNYFEVNGEQDATGKREEDGKTSGSVAA